MFEKLNVLKQLFTPKPKELCCGVELVDSVKEVSATTSQRTAQAEACCTEPGAQIPAAGMRGTAEQATLAEAGNNAFLVRRAEALAGLPGNPYKVHFKESKNAKAIAIINAPTPALNRIFCVNLRDPASVRDFDEWFKSLNGSPVYQIARTGDHPFQPPSGFARLSDWDHAGLFRDDMSEIEARADVAIERITRRDADGFMRIYAEAFEYPARIAQPLCRSIEMLIGEEDVFSYIAKVDGEPVAVGQLYIAPDGMGYLGSTGTLPATRGRGCQAALDARRISDARQAGCVMLCRTVQVNSQSWRNALRIGFRTAYREELYAPHNAAASAGTSAVAKLGDGCCANELSGGRAAVQDSTTLPAGNDGCCANEIAASRR